ncbi:hypothetical protein E4U55_001548 [Claviceps digitariae]|nr:hypothetical protein E4U55_001548 [Claviceps digitariae]
MVTSPDYFLDQDGDLTLLVGTTPSQTIQVDSKVLCRNSPVFSRMLTGPFLESRRRHHSPAWTVTLPDDNPHALLILMDIIHNEWKHASSEPELDTLCHVLSLADKYDMAKTLRSVASAWLEHAKRETADSLDGKEAYLYVAYELGDAELFNQIAIRIASEYTVDEAGKLLAPSGTSCFIDNEFVKRTNIMDEIQTYRTKHLAHIQSTCQRYLHSLATTKRNLTRQQRRQTYTSRDELMGHILRGARKRQITGVFLTSVDDLGVGWRTRDIVAKIKRISRSIPAELFEACCMHATHTKARIHEDLGNVSPPASDFHREYMARQAAETRFVGGDLGNEVKGDGG